MPQNTSSIHHFERRSALRYKTHTAVPVHTAVSLWLISQKDKIRQEKEINLPDRTSTPYSVCGNKNAVEPQCQGMPPGKAGLLFRQDTEVWLGFVDLFTHLLPPCSQGLSHSLFLSAEGKKLGTQELRKEELGRTEEKKSSTAAKTTYHLSSFPSSFLIQDAASLIPILVSLPAL